MIHPNEHRAADLFGSAQAARLTSPKPLKGVTRCLAHALLDADLCILSHLLHNWRMLQTTVTAWRKPTTILLLVALLTGAPLLAQDPWSGAATRMATAFTGPIVRGFSLVAIVVGGLTLAFSEGGGKRTLGGLIFGLGMALGATQFMSWLFS